MIKRKNDNIKKVIKFYFAWNEAEEGQWLRNMGNKGWHLKSYSPFRYIFEKGEPKDYVYQFDFFINSTEKEEEYLEIFSASGWNYITKFKGWYFFRKLYRKEDHNEIYSDKDSLKQKYNKLLKIVTLSIFPLLSSLLLFIILAFTSNELNDLFSYIKYFLIIVGFIAVWWIYALIRIILIRKK